MKKLLIVSLLLTTGLLGCELFQQVTAAQLVVGTYTRTPLLEVGGVTLQEEQVATSLFFGERDPAAPLDIAPTALPGATVVVQVTAANFAEVTLPGDGNGLYSATSLTEPALTYEPGGAYRFDITLDSLGETFTAQLSEAPTPEAPGGVPTTAHPANTELTITRTGTDTAFVSVVRLDPTNGVEETWHNRPQSPTELIRSVLEPGPWEETSFTIPGTAFPSAGQYAIILTVTKKAIPGANLFAGSAVYVGAAEAATLEVQ